MPECYVHRENDTLGHSQKGFSDKKEQMCMVGYVQGSRLVISREAS